MDMDQISLKTKRIYDPKTGRSYVVLDVPQPLEEPQIESSRYFCFHSSELYMQLHYAHLRPSTPTMPLYSTLDSTLIRDTSGSLYYDDISLD